MNPALLPSCFPALLQIGTVASQDWAGRCRIANLFPSHPALRIEKIQPVREYVPTQSLAPGSYKELQGLALVQYSGSKLKPRESLLAYCSVNPRDLELGFLNNHLSVPSAPSLPKSGRFPLHRSQGALKGFAT